MAKKPTTTETETTTSAKTKRVNRGACANKVVSSVKGKTTLSELAKQADALFVEAGGKSKLKAATISVRRALDTAEALGAVKLVRPSDLYVERL